MPFQGLVVDKIRFTFSVLKEFIKYLISLSRSLSIAPKQDDYLMFKGKEQVAKATRNHPTIHHVADDSIEAFYKVR